jgi:hypothetical protein
LTGEASGRIRIMTHYGISGRAHVRFASESGHVQRIRPCPLWATSGLMHRSKQQPYSITSSARRWSCDGTSRPSAFAV